MAVSSPETILGMAILLLVAVGLCLAIAFRLLKSPARRFPVQDSLANASPSRSAQPRRAGAVERMDAAIAAESGAEWKRPPAARTSRPGTTPRTDLKAMHDAALDEARRVVLQRSLDPAVGDGRPEPDPARMAAYWSGEAIQAAKADQYEAASYAGEKATLYKRLAKQAAKAAAAARRAKRLAEAPVANRKKD
jgi:hypothetical protein